MVKQRANIGMLKSVMFSMDVIAKLKRNTSSNDRIKSLNFHLGNLQKLKNLCTFSISDNQFDFMTTFKTIETKLTRVG